MSMPVGPGSRGSSNHTSARRVSGARVAMRLAIIASFAIVLFAAPMVVLSPLVLAMSSLAGLAMGLSGLAALASPMVFAFSEAGLLGAAAGLVTGVLGRAMAARRRRRGAQSLASAVFSPDIWRHSLSGTVGMLLVSALGGYFAVNALELLAAGDVGQSASTLALIGGTGGGGGPFANAFSFNEWITALALMVGAALGFGALVGFGVGLPAGALYQAVAEALGWQGIVHGLAEGAAEHAVTGGGRRRGFVAAIVVAAFKGGAQSALAGAMSNLMLAAARALGLA